MIETAELSDYLIEYYPTADGRCHEIDLIGLKSVLKGMSIEIKLESGGPDLEGKEVKRLYVTSSDGSFSGLPGYNNLRLYKAEKDLPDMITSGQWLIDLGTYTSERSAAKSSGLTFQFDAKLRKFSENGFVCSNDEGAMHQLLYISPTGSNPLNFRELKYTRDRCKTAFIDENIVAYRFIK